MNSPAQAKLGRNDPCPCGSGKKYKACCAQTEAKFKTRQAPNLDALLSRARQAVQQGDFESAEFFFRQVLTASPNHAEALAGVGQGLCWRRKRREGKTYLVQAARQLEKGAIKTRDTRLLTDLSAQLQYWGEMEAALRLAHLGVRLAPRSAVVQNNLALCLSRVNRVKEAVPAVAKACELLPREPGCLILQAILDSRQGQTEKARRQLEQVIADDRVAEQTARAWLELGTVLDRLGEFDQAFAAFEEAGRRHAALPEARAFDAEHIFSALAHNRAGFDRDLLNRWAGAVFDDDLPAPTFLFGFLRSGTTLTEQVLAAHPDVIASDENDFVFELCGELARITGIHGDEAAALRRIDLGSARQLRRFYWQRVTEEYGPEALQKSFVDKLSLNSINAGLIATLFPEARILFALRDPRDVCLSCFMQAFSPSPATINLLSWESIARQYAAVMDLWLHLRPMIACEYLELRYEDTVFDFQNTYRRVFDLLGVDWHPDVVRFHEKAKGKFISTPSFAAVSQPLYNSAVARWQRYEKHFTPILPNLERFIEAFGYRIDDRR